ncbi:MAG: DMT family transporter [Bacteroidia bacterium]|jgi:drug/metabolite transporter (DMT)-like permease|nr:DMT family transporter [Bacteroidia bacterium]
MIYLLLSILFSTITVSFFKIFDLKKIDTFSAIVFNYLTCTLIGTYFSSHKIYEPQIWQSNWIFIAAGLGFLFISIFYLIALTAQKISISASMVSAKLSVVIPVLVALIFFNENITWLKAIGILNSLIAVYFISKKDNIDVKNKLLIFLPMAVFLGSGLIDSLLKYLQQQFVPLYSADDIVTATFFFAGVFGALTLITKGIYFKNNIQLKSIIWGVLLGVPNYFSMFFLVQTLTQFDATFIFPINNIGIVAGSSITAYFVFKEKLSKQNVFGLLFAFIAIILISFSS